MVRPIVNPNDAFVEQLKGYELLLQSIKPTLVPSDESSASETLGPQLGPQMPTNIINAEILGPQMPRTITNTEILGPQMPSNITNTEILGPKMPSNITNTEILGPQMPSNITKAEILGPQIPTNNIEGDDINKKESQAIMNELHANTFDPIATTTCAETTEPSLKRIKS